MPFSSFNFVQLLIIGHFYLTKMARKRKILLALDLFTTWSAKVKRKLSLFQNKLRALYLCPQSFSMSVRKISLSPVNTSSSTSVHVTP